jgi:hypothetical protein
VTSRQPLSHTHLSVGDAEVGKHAVLGVFVTFIGFETFASGAIPEANDTAQARE